MKGREFVGQHQPVQAQDHQGAADVRPRSPYLLSGEAADFLRYRGRHKLRSLYRFLKAKGIVPVRRQHTLLIKKADLLKALPGRCLGDE